MLRTCGMQSKELSILREENSSLRDAEGQLLFIRGSSQTCFRRRDDIDAAAPQTLGDRSVAVLIQVEPDRSGHRLSFA
jgi:hypothetical protein